jgi:hypothetical protein
MIIADTRYFFSLFLNARIMTGRASTAAAISAAALTAAARIAAHVARRLRRVQRIRARPRILGRDRRHGDAVVGLVCSHAGTYRDDTWASEKTRFAEQTPNI